MKMSSVIQPQSFLQGVGQYSYDEMLHGLSWLGATAEDVVGSLQGLGGLSAANMSVMDAIISNASEIGAKNKVLQSERMKAAKSDPQFAMKLSAAMKKTAAPGTNVAAGVAQASFAAAKTAMAAKVLEKKTVSLLASNDKRAAAAQAVNALTAAREALIISTGAEKTRLTTSLDNVAHTLEEQARYVENTMQNEMSRSGPSGRTDKLRASAQALRVEAEKLRKTSAVVAVAPVVPPNAPTQSRIAEVANKFNLRAVGRGTQANVVSVLSDLSDSALAQVRDYEGALKFYGNDAVGRLMCDMEFDNKQAALKGLSAAIHGMGYVDTLPVFARADKALAQGVREAQRGFTNAVLPAFVGNQRGLQQMQMASVQLGGLGRPYAFTVGPAEADKWDRVCEEEYGVNGKTPDAEQLNKCLKPGPGCDFFQPWEAVGRACRGNITIGQAIAQIGAGIVKGDVKLPPIPTMGNQTPPASTLPPKSIPYENPVGIKTVAMQSGSSTGTYVQPGSYGLPTDNKTMFYAAAGIGAVVLGAGVYWTMIRKAV